MLKQDFHLAKRHYDSAYETNSEAYLPVALSLLKLHARSIWHTLMGGSNGLSLFGNDIDESGACDSHSEVIPGLTRICRSVVSYLIRGP